MSNVVELVGRKGLARILDVSEGTTRNIERRGQIVPDRYVDGRALFSVEKAQELRAARDSQRRTSGLRA